MSCKVQFVLFFVVELWRLGHMFKWRKSIALVVVAYVKQLLFSQSTRRCFWCQRPQQMLSLTDVPTDDVLPDVRPTAKMQWCQRCDHVALINDAFMSPLLILLPTLCLSNGLRNQWTQPLSARLADKWTDGRTRPLLPTRAAMPQPLK